MYGRFKGCTNQCPFNVILCSKDLLYTYLEIFFRTYGNSNLGLDASQVKSNHLYLSRVALSALGWYQ